MKKDSKWYVVTGLDGSGKSTLISSLAHRTQSNTFTFRIPYFDFVQDLLKVSGEGTQFGDVHSDRLIFATDARLVNKLIKDWKQKYDLLISQRAWMDNYVFGKVQGVSDEETHIMLKQHELEKPDAIIWLTADPEVAYNRIKDDPNKDKYETIEFMQKQAQATKECYEKIEKEEDFVSFFSGIPNILIDTTSLTQEETLDEAILFLEQL